MWFAGFCAKEGETSNERVKSMVPIPIIWLWELAESEGIIVEWYPQENYPLGRYCYADGLSFIFLNPVIQESSRLYRCTFAHELGHYYATVAGMPGDDELALEWARRIVLPDSWVLPRRHMNPARLAEEADVYEEWVAARIRDIWNRLSGRFCALKGDVKC